MKGKICIVDHDLASRGFLRECLESDGHEVVVLNNGYQIKSALTGKRFNVFILNIETPGVKEKNLFLDLKESHLSRILLIVSERGDPFLKEAIDSGVYGFIYKPFKLNEVCTMVTHLVR